MSKHNQFDHDRLRNLAPGRPGRRMVMKGIAATVATLPSLAGSGPAQAHPPAPGSLADRMSQPFADWIITRQNLLGQVCCDIADGRPTTIRFNEKTGEREALISKEMFGPDAPDTYLPIPQDAELKAEPLITQKAHEKGVTRQTQKI